MSGALERIASGLYEDFGPYKAEEIARAALEVKPVRDSYGTYDGSKNQNRHTMHRMRRLASQAPGCVEPAAAENRCPCTRSGIHQSEGSGWIRSREVPGGVLAPDVEDGGDELPRRLHLVAPGEERGVAVEGVEEEPLVGVGGVLRRSARNT